MKNIADTINYINSLKQVLITLDQKYQDAAWHFSRLSTNFLWGEGKIYDKYSGNFDIYQPEVIKMWSKDAKWNEWEEMRKSKMIIENKIKELEEQSVKIATAE